MREGDGAVRKIAGDLADHHGLAVPLERSEGLDRVLILLPGLCIPLLDGGNTVHRSAFIVHNGIIGEALCQSDRIASALGGEIGGDLFGQYDRHLGQDGRFVRDVTALTGTNVVAAIASARCLRWRIGLSWPSDKNARKSK